MEMQNCYSVTQINELVKSVFDNIPLFNKITLKGEISNYRGRNKSGHLYFSLKDDKCSINAVIFKFDSYSLDFEPKNGDEVIVTGSISSYPPSGTYQIICRSMSLYGKGLQLLKKQALKEKLYKEGIFDASHKKEIPSFPENIAIITGKNSAAAKDFEFNLLRRFPLVNIKIFYSLVQGMEAPKDLIKNLSLAINSKPDVIIIGRGGGSEDDLEAFDNEELVLAIYKCNIPIISAVGHEINQSLCDLVADKYASTPTGACEIAVPDINDILEDLKQYNSLLKTSITRLISSKENALLRLKNEECLTNIENIFGIYQEKINAFKERLYSSLNYKINTCSKQIEYLAHSLELVNPTNILKKGFTITYLDNGKILKSIEDVHGDSIIKTKVADGIIKSIVKEKK